MITLGIPGDTVTSLLLGGLLIHGIEAGPLLMTNSASYVNALFFGAVCAAFLVLFLQFFGMRTFPFILRLPFKYLFSTIAMLCFIGTYSANRSIAVLWIMVVMSAIGFLLRFAKFSFSPMLLGFILGPMLEKYFRRGLSYDTNGWQAFFTRPISCLLLVIAFGSLFWPFIRKRLDEKKAAKAAESDLPKITAVEED